MNEEDYDEDELIEEIRRRDERIRELEEQIAELGTGRTSSLKLKDIMQDPQDKLPETNIRVEPRTGGKGVFLHMQRRTDDARAIGAAMDLGTAETVAYTILYICTEERIRNQQELDARSDEIDNDF